MYKKLPIIANTALPYATRETAFIHAISSAAVVHEITAVCTASKMPGCGCSKPKQHKEHRRQGIFWAKCGDHIEFGEKKARHIMDSLEKGSPGVRAVNLHNNEVGREVVRTMAEVSCKCHGFNTACKVKTCWKELAPLEVVASKLKQKYHNAVQVWFMDNKLQERVDNQFRPISNRDQRLVYLDSSPDFCVRNDTLGTPGMLGQSCRSDKAADKCKSFVDYCESCKLRVESEERYKQVKCNCTFVWCCHVDCETCTKKYSVMTCSGLAKSGVETH
ncbi:protein Wnt-8b-like [Oculina patagonica]